MIRFLSALLIGSLFTITLLNGAVAQNPFGSCENVKSSAEALKCVKDNKEKAQAKLNKLFEQVAKTLDEDDLVRFRNAQREWVQFRTEQCQLEQQLARVESLRTLYRLECIEKLTLARLAHVGKLIEWHESDQPREFGDYPRWVNIIEQDHPDIVWDLKSRVNADLDCDGKDEHAITGVEIRNGETSQTGESGEDIFDISVAIGILKNDNANRPESVVKKFRLNAAHGNNGPRIVCSPHVDIDIVRTKQPGVDKTSGHIPPRKPRRICENALQISDSVCHPVIIHYIDNAYQVSPFKGQ